jgi:hypothetical protein
MSNTAKKAVEPSGVPATETQKEVTPGKVIDLVKKEPSLNAKAEERIEKLNDFLHLRDVHDKLREKQNDLNEILKSEDSLSGCKLEIRNSAGKSVSISNTSVVKEVVAVAKGKLDESVTKAQMDVLTFEI